MRCALLAGGKGTRLNFAEKPLLRVCGKRIIELVITELRIPTLIVCSEEKAKLYRKVAEELDSLAEVEVVPDKIPDFGPSGGIYTALLEWGDVVVIAGDMPFVRKEVVRLLWNEGRIGYDAVIPMWSDGKKEPLLAYYSSKSLKAFERAIELKERKIMKAVEKMSKVKFLDMDIIKNFDKDLVSFFNVNTPEDLRRADELCSSIDLAGE